MKKIIYALGILAGITPLIAQAHVKWFAEDLNHVQPYSLSDVPVLISIALGIGIILLGFYLNKTLSVPHWYKRLVQRYAPHVLSIASIGFGISYLIFSYMGFIFAPNLQAVGTIGTTLLLIQAVAGIMILLGFFERAGGLLLIILFVLSIKVYGFTEMMDAFEMLGFAIYAVLIGRPKWKIKESLSMSTLTHTFHRYGVPVLRIGTGINLIVLGFSEKILAPGLTQNFLQTYEWNFMEKIGLSWYTDYWFAYSAGFVEMLFGIFLLFGLITRTTIIVLAVFLVSTLVLLGPLELIGHLPHFSIAAVLLVFGAGPALAHRKEHH